MGRSFRPWDNPHWVVSNEPSRLEGAVNNASSHGSYSSGGFGGVLGHVAGGLGAVAGIVPWPLRAVLVGSLVYLAVAACGGNVAALPTPAPAPVTAPSVPTPPTYTPPPVTAPPAPATPPATARTGNDVQIGPSGRMFGLIVLSVAVVFGAWYFMKRRN